MSIRLILFLAVFMPCITKAQLTPMDKAGLAKQESELKSHAKDILFGIEVTDRFTADSLFTRKLVAALKTPYSFQYPFDSLESISRLYAPDSSFRIFTWNLYITDASARRHGAIQMRTADGSLKLFPLIDKSDVTEDISKPITDNLNWIGAVYYRIILKEYRGKKFYTLIGFDENDLRSHKKIIDILRFENEKPVFGAPVFSFPDDKIVPKKVNRFVMEYKRDAGARLNYDEMMDLIVKEHLVSESNEPNKKYTLVGDGDYEAFKWMDGKWVYVSKIFFEITPEGKAPIPNKILDDKGNIDESKIPGFNEDKPIKEKKSKKN